MNLGQRIFGIGGIVAAASVAGCGGAVQTNASGDRGTDGSSGSEANSSGGSGSGSSGGNSTAGSASSGSGGASSSGSGTSSASSGGASGSSSGGSDAAVQTGDAGIAPCGDGSQVCGGQCVDTMDDPQNCGGCSQPCGIGLTCSGGACACGGNATLCGTQCVDLQTDSANCGSCDHNCEGNPCSDSLCSPSIIALAQGGYLVGDIVANSTDIFWTSPDSAQALGGVMGQSFASTMGGATTIAYATLGTEPSPLGIAVDLDNLYWVDSAVPGRVVEYNFLSGDRFTWSDDDAGASPIVSPVDVAVDTNNIYWVDVQAGTVNQTSITPGGPIYVLAQNRANPRAIATDGTNVYWVDFGTESGLDANGSVNQVPVDGGDVVSLSTGEDQPWDIVTDGAYVYWTDDGNPGSVKRVAVGGGAPPTVLASDQPAPSGIALDPAPAQFVYWTNYDGETVMKMPIAGTGTPYTIAAQQDTPAAIFVDEVNVYWAGGAAIYKVAK